MPKPNMLTETAHHSSSKFNRSTSSTRFAKFPFKIGINFKEAGLSAIMIKQNSRSIQY